MRVQECSENADAIASEAAQMAESRGSLEQELRAIEAAKDTVAIECVHEDGAERARLDVHQLDGFSLFPGQVPVP